MLSKETIISFCENMTIFDVKEMVNVAEAPEVLEEMVDTIKMIKVNIENDDDIISTLEIFNSIGLEKKLISKERFIERSEAIHWMRRDLDILKDNAINLLASCDELAKYNEKLNIEIDALQVKNIELSKVKPTEKNLKKAEEQRDFLAFDIFETYNTSYRKYLEIKKDFQKLKKDLYKAETREYNK